MGGYAVANDGLHWHNNVAYRGVIEWSGSTTTNGSGQAIYYLTDDGTASGNAIFSTVLLESMQLTPLSTNRILLNSAPTLSVDNKTLTITVNQNTSLLSLGLIPFSTAASGFTIYMNIKGV